MYFSNYVRKNVLIIFHFPNVEAILEGIQDTYPSKAMKKEGLWNITKHDPMISQMTMTRFVVAYQLEEMHPKLSKK